MFIRILQGNYLGPEVSFLGVCITNSISLIAIELFTLSLSYWVSCHSSWFSKKPISSIVKFMCIELFIAFPYHFDVCRVCKDNLVLFLILLICAVSLFSFVSLTRGVSSYLCKELVLCFIIVSTISVFNFIDFFCCYIYYFLHFTCFGFIFV